MAPVLSTLVTTLVCLTPLTAGFPKLTEDAATQLKVLEEALPYERRQVAFDPQAQFVSTTGKHAWRAPRFDSGEQRGPCPGLNALSNHGYLPRSGVTPWTTIAKMTNEGEETLDLAPSGGTN